MSKVTGMIAGAPSNGLDLAQRDPNNLNEHLQVMWDDVFGEPEGVRSTDCAWSFSYKCFHSTRSCCYLLLTTLFAPFLAFCAAMNCACLRTWKINCSFVRACCTVCMAAWCGPCAETCGLYFSKVKVRYQRLPDGEEEKDIMIV